MPAGDVVVYEADGDTECRWIDWGDVTAGENKSYIIVVENTGNPTKLHLTTEGLNPLVGTVSWNYSGAPLKDGESIPIEIYFVSSGKRGEYNFNILISGV